MVEDGQTAGGLGRGLSVERSGHVVVGDIEVSIASEQVPGLFGPSGSGKSSSRVGPSSLATEPVRRPGISPRPA
jgi:ABC-type glutathione transport system ATPase component